MSFFEFVGLATLSVIGLKLAWIFMNFLRVTFFADLFGLTMDPKKQGKWAVVTGSTDGIGKAYAEELAKRGMDIVLISRSMDKLENVAAEIRDRFNVKTKVISADFTKSDIYEGISKELSGLDIGILVNNVGMSYAYPEFLWKVENPMEFCNRLTHCNITSVTHMSLLVLPKMIEKRKGIILNVSSASAKFPTPFLAVYASSKAFVVKFSRDLAAECAPYDVTVQCVLPGFVATKLSNIKKISIGIPNPTTYVRGAMKSLGLEVESYGYFVHRFVFSVYELAQALAGPVVTKLSWYSLYTMRAKALHRMKKHGDLSDEVKAKSSTIGGVQVADAKRD